MFGYLGGLHYWWPKISGRMYPDGWGRFLALVIFVGFNLTFFPQFIAGYLGMPHRYHSYPPEFQVFNVLYGGSINSGCGVFNTSGLGFTHLRNRRAESSDGLRGGRR